MVEQRITLRSSFHGTQADVTARDGRLTARQIKRVKSAMCGVRGCKCGGVIDTMQHGFSYLEVRHENGHVLYAEVSFKKTFIPY